MTDRNDNDTPEQAVEDQGPQCGQRLAEARLAQHVSVLDIAKELHISEETVAALERNEFESLGAAVFAKGYIRKYSQFVGLPEDELLAEYEQLASESTVVPVLKARPRPRREIAPGPWIAVFVVIILAATAYWWITERPFDDATVPTEPAAATEPEARPPAAEEPIDRVDEADVDGPGPEDATVQRATEPAAVAAE